MAFRRRKSRSRRHKQFRGKKRRTNPLRIGFRM